MENKYKVIIASALLILGITMLIIHYDPTPKELLSLKNLGQTNLTINFSKDYQKINMDNSDEIYQEALIKIDLIAWNVSQSHTYILNVYDCTDFSKELVKELKEAGFKAECQAGFYQGDKAHTWVNVWINNTKLEVEATGGYIIPDDIYKSDYKPIWSGGMCW